MLRSPLVLIAVGVVIVGCGGEGFREPDASVLTAPTKPSALVAAVYESDVAQVRRLLAARADVNARDPAGRTALTVAVIAGGGEARAQKVVRLLLKHGADPSIPGADGKTALQQARAKGYTEIARLIEGAS